MRGHPSETQIVFPQDLDFGFEDDVAFLACFGLDLVDQSENLAGIRPAAIDDEVSMFLGDLGGTNHATFEADFVDQLPGPDRLGILENAAGAGGDRLAGTTLLLGRLSPLPNLVRIDWPAASTTMFVFKLFLLTSSALFPEICLFDMFVTNVMFPLPSVALARAFLSSRYFRYHLSTASINVFQKPFVS